jgi:hypothetical protein
MATERTGIAFLAIGAGCFLLGGLAVALRALGSGSLAQEQTTSLAVAGLMAVAIGAALRNRS